MSDDAPVPPPAPLPSAPVPNSPSPASRRGAWAAAGFVTGAVLAALPFLSQSYDGIPVLIFDAFALPVIAIVLAIIPATRSFGLGLLLACGLGWLILLSICSGMLR